MSDLYVIRVEGHLDERWSDWLEDMAVRREPDGTTTLEGMLADQAALHSVLTRMRDLAVPIVSVQKTDSE